ncbi:permease [Microbacterium gorillae]|uniref:permease n=1 Tax=Microbacterium gorillae TaxID=1231063 RepID=UPI00058FF821|nr:permease [Microbacterium gorillae]
MTTTTDAPARRAPNPTVRIVGVALLLAVIVGAFVVPLVFDVSLPTRVQDGLTLAISVLIESMPFVMIGVILAIVVQVWLPPDLIGRVLPKRAWPRRLALSCLGILIPVCECGNVPFARGLLRRGVSPADTLTFLLAAPIVNPIVIVTTHAAFGWDSGILIARLIGGLVIANLIGWLFSRHPDPQRLLTERFRIETETEECATGSRTRRSLVQAIIELRAVMPALIIGSALAGAVQVVVPRDVLVAVGANPALSLVAMAALAIVVALCSNVDAFFALSLASAFTPGSIVVFLLVGPLVDVKMLALMRTTFTVRTLALITALVLGIAFLFGIGVNLLV